MHLRSRVLLRDPVCTVCDFAPSTEVDHVVPLHAGGHPTRLDNLRGCCSSCHLALTLEDRRGA